MSIIFKPEEAVEATKDFAGQIVAVDYSEKPFGFAGAANIQARGKVFAVQIRTESYEKPQYEWYPPNKIKKTKWVYLLEALTVCGAMREITVAGASDDERIASFGKSLLGMKFRWMEMVKESLVKEVGANAGFRKFSVLLPVEYAGKHPIEEQQSQATLRSGEIGEAPSEIPTEGRVPPEGEFGPGGM